MNKLELLDCINEISRLDSNKYNLPISDYIQNSNYSIPINSNDSLFYYVSSFKKYSDTLFNENSKKIISINNYEIPLKDTLYVSLNGTFEYSVEVGKYFKEVSSNYCDRVKCILIIIEKNDAVILKLHNINIHNCTGMFDKKTEKIQKERLIYSFEKEIVEKIGSLKK